MKRQASGIVFSGSLLLLFTPTPLIKIAAVLTDYGKTAATARCFDFGGRLRSNMEATS